MHYVLILINIHLFDYKAIHYYIIILCSNLLLLVISKTVVLICIKVYDFMKGGE